MRAVLIVAAGGALGSAARHLVNLAAQRAGTAWPLGTILVNLTGCLAVGLAAGLAVARPSIVPPAWRLFLVVGVCGGFTTFSAFGLETLELIRTGRLAAAGASAALQVGLGLLMVWLGILISKLI